METLLSELLDVITQRLMLHQVSCWAQTNKKFNNLIWTFVKTLTDKELSRITSYTNMTKFKNLEECLLSDITGIVPQALDKLSKLRNLQITLDQSSGRDDELPLVKKLTILQELCLNLLHVSSKEMAAALLDHTKLTYLAVTTHGGYLCPFAWEMWEVMTRVQHLKLNERRYRKYFSSNFVTSIWTLTQLRGLSLSGGTNGSNSLMASGISNLTNLEDLGIYGCKAKHTNNLFIDYNKLLDLQKLTSLSILGLNDSHSNIISRLTNLQKLELFELTDEVEIGNYSNLSKLTWIWFVLNTKKSDPGLEFRKMPNLEFVAIPMCPNITQLVHLTNLRELRVDERHFTGNLRFLQELTTLQSLRITASEMLFKGDGVDLSLLTRLDHVHISLPGKPSLQELNPTEGFIKALSTVPSLSKLSLEGYREELMPLIATLTQLQVVKLPRIRAAVDLQKNKCHFLIERN